MHEIKIFFRIYKFHCYAMLLQHYKVQLRVPVVKLAEHSSSEIQKWCELILSEAKRFFHVKESLSDFKDTKMEKCQSSDLLKCLYK